MLTDPFLLMTKSQRDNIHYSYNLIIALVPLLSNNLKVLYFHATVCILTILHWHTNEGKCFLSEYDYQGESEYTKQILSFVGIYPQSNLELEFYAHSFFIIPLFISLYKIKYL